MPPIASLQFTVGELILIGLLFLVIVCQVVLITRR